MFGKKLLSIVSLLFLGSQLSKVSAECNWDGGMTINGETPTCTGLTGCTDDEYGYYYKAATAGSVTNVMVKVKSATECDIVQAAGYYIGKDDTYYKVDTTNLAAAVDTSAQIENNESGSGPYKCENANDVGKLYYNSDAINICVAAATGKPFGEGNYFLITEGSGTSGLLGGAASVVVSLVDTDAIKVVTPDDSLVVSEITGDISNASGGENTSVVPNDLIVLDSDSKVKNTFDCEDFCLDKTTRKLLERKPEYCNSETECVGYYTCDDGVCEDKSIIYPPRFGGGNEQTCDTNALLIAGGEACAGRAGDYYFIASAAGKTEANLADALTITVGTTGYLHKCTIAANGDSSCGEETGLAGYFVSQNDGGDGITYIQCTPANAGATVCKGLMDAPAVITSAITACGSGSGKLEDGAYINGDDYIVCSGGSSTSTLNINNLIQLTSTCESAGQIIKDGAEYKLCVKNSAVDTLDTTGVAFSAASYFVDASVTNAFNDQALAVNGKNHYYVVVDIDDKSAVVQRSTTPKKYKYAVAATNEIVEKANAESKGICSTSEFQDAGHEFQMTKENSDNVNYYRDLDRANAD